MGRDLAWLDTGAHDSLLEAPNFIETLEGIRGLKIACPEEFAYRNCFISRSDLESLASPQAKNSHFENLKQISSEKQL